MGTMDITSKVKTATRAVPEIYAYTTPEVKRHDGWTKIGYTEQGVHERIKQQSHTIDVECVLEWHGNAIYEDGSGDTFKDHDFHAYLRKLGYNGNLENEWFEITPLDSKERFYAFRETRGLLEAKGASEYKLRAEQKRAVDETTAYVNGNVGGEFLWNAKPRFGKTLTAYDLCKRLGAVKVLIVTNRPDIANSWYDDYVKFLGLNSGYHFVTHVEALKDALFAKTREEYLKYLQNHRGEKDVPKRFIEFVSLQDLKGSIHFGGVYDKLGEVADLEWDVLIIDEAHEGVDTYKTDVAFDHIRRKFTLHLSGTPFKAIANDKFPASAIYNWTYADEQQAKRDWDDPEMENPYADLPQLNMFTYQMSDIIEQKVAAGADIDGETVEYAFDLNEFFATNGNGKFLHDADVDRFLDVLTTQTKFPFSTPELRDELRHTFWMLNRVDSARSLAKKLKAHPVFGEYEVVLAAGDGRIDDDDENEKSLAKVRRAIAEHDKTITLSVGQLTTGITVPEWTAVLMLSNMKSPSLYMQAAFRAQNPCLFFRGGEYFRKRNAYVFDFDPARTLTIFEQFANDLYAETAVGKGDTDARKRRICQLLNFFPVFGEDEDGEMVELDAERVLSIPRRIRSQEVVRRGFMSDFLFQNISNIFHAPAEVVEIIQNFEPYKEPNTDLGVKSGTADELDINAEGDVEVPEEQVIGLATDLFGDKVYGVVEDELEDAIDYWVMRMDEERDVDEEAMLTGLKKTFTDGVAKPLVEAARESYGSELRPAQRKTVERKIKAEAEVTLNKQVGDYRIQKNLLEKQRRDELAQASSAREADEINRRIDSKKREAFDKLVANVSESKSGLVKSAGETIVREVETGKRESVKSDIESGIRDHLRGFSRTIPSFLMAYGNESTTLATFEAGIPEEVFEEVTSITAQEFRNLRDGFDYADVTTGETRHYEGHLFDEVVFDDSVREFIRLRNELSDYFDPSIEGDIFDYVPPQKTNQIYTPKHVVKQMIDLFEEENPGCFNDPEHTFADLYMKSGLFITEIVTRLYNSEKMCELLPDDKERLTHILSEQVFGIAPTEIIYRIAVNFILGYGKYGDWMDSNFVRADSAALAKEGKLAQFVEDTYGGKLGKAHDESDVAAKATIESDANIRKPADEECAVVQALGEVATPSKTDDDDWIIAALEDAGIPFVDKRDTGGSLWAIGGRELVKMMADFEKCGLRFKYKEGGGKATKGRDAWWMK